MGIFRILKFDQNQHHLFCAKIFFVFSNFFVWNIKQLCIFSLCQRILSCVIVLPKWRFFLNRFRIWFFVILHVTAEPWPVVHPFEEIFRKACFFNIYYYNMETYQLLRLCGFRPFNPHLCCSCRLLAFSKIFQQRF